jgi:flagellar L-ring protein FlgH
MNWQRLIMAAIILFGLDQGAVVSTCRAESLFRASAQYDGMQPTPRSLFFQPAPRWVGDLVTIQLDEKTQSTITSTVRVDRKNTLQDNSTGLTNNAVRSLLRKVPIISNNTADSIANRLALPSFDGLNDKQTVQSQAQSQKQSQIKDSITCQVTEVLPNGYLVVQGQKNVLMNKENTTLFVSGIINPYYMDRNNSIVSTRVGNLQMLAGGRGVISRQQGDGVASKLYHLLH